MQFGPLTAGRITSFYDFYANDLAFSAQLGSDRVTQTLAYPRRSATGSRQRCDGRPDRASHARRCVQPQRLHATRSQPIPIFRSRAPSAPSRSADAGGVTVPDGVANIRYDNTAFGSAQLSAAVHQFAVGNLTPNIRGGSFRPDVVDTSTGSRFRAA